MQKEIEAIDRLCKELEEVVSEQKQIIKNLDLFTTGRNNNGKSEEGETSAF